MRGWPRAIAAVTVLAVLGSGGAVVFTGAGTRAAAVSPPPGVRIRVQVLNATTTRGLARRATAYLRDRGFDVIDVGMAPTLRDTTVVIDRSARPAWAALVGRALGTVRVETALDSLGYVDVTVLLGRDWSLPTEPFYP